MDLMEALRTRRAIREFTAEPIDARLIDDLIAAAILAPSAMGLEPWAFVVVQGAERLRALEPEAKSYAAAHLPSGSPLMAHATDPSFAMFHGAAALIIICAVNSDS